MPHKLRMKPLGSGTPQRVRMRTLKPEEALPHSPWQEEKRKPDDSEDTLITLPPWGAAPQILASGLLQPPSFDPDKARPAPSQRGEGCWGLEQTPARSGAPPAPHPRPPRLRPARPAADSWWEAAFPAHSDKFLAVRAALQPPRPRRGKLPWKEED